jgi:membrane-associated protease RseP (regulator of RpoE activity)
VFPPAQVLTGARVTNIVPNGPAEKAGVQVGDTITAVDNIPVDANHLLGDLIQVHKPGDKVSLSIVRGTQTLTLSVELGTSTANSSQAFLGIQYASMFPDFATPRPLVPGTAIPRPSVPNTATPQPTVPSTAIPRPSVPNTATPQPTVPSTATPFPTAPNTATPLPSPTR